MVTVSAEFIPVKENLIEKITCNIHKINISKDITYLFNQENKGGNPFILGSSPLNGTADLSKEKLCYIGTEAADSNGDFDKEYQIVINGNDMQDLVITFDNFNNQYPNNIIVNGELYTLNSPKIKIQLEKTNKIDITINNWNAPYYPLRIQSINTFYIAINQDNLKRLSNTIFDRSNIELPSYGILSNTAELEFIDANEETLYYLNIERLTIDSLARMKINNQNIGVFYVSEWNYDNDDKTVNVNLQDNLNDWQSYTVNNIYYNFKHPVTQPLRYFYDYLKNISEQQGFEFAPLDTETEAILDNTVIQYVFLESDNLWNEWYKLCKASLLYIYKNNNNQVVVIHKI